MIARPALVLAACAGLSSCSSDPGEGSAEPFRLCSWNIERLGFDNGKDYRALAEILEDHCDAAVLLEVMPGDDGAPGYEALRSELGNDWTGARTEDPRPKGASYSEHSAIVWRADRLEFCEGFFGLRLVPDGDDGDEKDLFDREPAFSCFKIAGTGFDFLLAAYHANWDDSIAVIQDEVRFIDAAAEIMLESVKNEDDLLILGDFNLTPENLSEVTELAIFGTGDGSTLNDSGARTDNLYDNLLVHSLSATPELTDRAEVLDLRNEAGGPESYAKHLSDHLPIRVTLFPSREDDD